MPHKSEILMYMIYDTHFTEKLRKPQLNEVQFKRVPENRSLTVYSKGHV